MGLPVTGLVNNTHLCAETTVDDILLGAGLADEVGYVANIPVICHMAPRSLAGDLPDMAEPVFPIDIYMKKPWER